MLISRKGAQIGWAGVHVQTCMSKRAYLERETFQFLIDMFVLPVLKGRHSILLEVTYHNPSPPAPGPPYMDLQGEC